MSDLPSDHDIHRLHVEARYSDVACHAGVAWLAGQVPDDAQVPIAEQTRQVLAHIDRLLGEAGSARSRILMATVYLADMADYAAMNAVWDAWIAASPAPPRATVQARLANPDWKIEIVVSAALR